MSNENEPKKAIRKKLKRWTGTMIVRTENTDGQTILDTKTIDLRASDPDDYCGKIHDILTNPNPTDEIYLDGKYVDHRITKCHPAIAGV